MTVGELIDALSGVPHDTLVVVSSDGEGNKISPLADAQPDWYVPDTPWDGDLIADEDLDEYADEIVAVVSLWPVN